MCACLHVCIYMHMCIWTFCFVCISVPLVWASWVFKFQSSFDFIKVYSFTFYILFRGFWISLDIFFSDIHIFSYLTMDSLFRYQDNTIPFIFPLICVSWFQIVLHNIHWLWFHHSLVYYSTLIRLSGLFPWSVLL